VGNALNLRGLDSPKEANCLRRQKADSPATHFTKGAKLISKTLEEEKTIMHHLSKSNVHWLTACEFRQTTFCETP